jgi:hypothetical protein
VKNSSGVTTASYSPADCGGYTKSGLRYQAESPVRRVDFELLEEGSIVEDSRSTIPVETEFVPSWWDTDETYGATKGPRRCSGRIGTLELADVMQEFECWCDQQSLKNPEGFSAFIAWKALFSHLEGAPMDDWREFFQLNAMEIELRRAYCSPDYVPLTLEGHVAATTPSNSGVDQKPQAQQQAGGNTAGVAQTSTAAPTFNPIVEFFKVLAKSYQGVRVDKLKSLQDFQRKAG